MALSILCLRTTGDDVFVCGACCLLMFSDYMSGEFGTSLQDKAYSRSCRTRREIVLRYAKLIWDVCRSKNLGNCRFHLLVCSRIEWTVLVVSALSLFGKIGPFNRDIHLDCSKGN